MIVEEESSDHHRRRIDSKPVKQSSTFNKKVLIPTLLFLPLAGTAIGVWLLFKDYNSFFNDPPTEEHCKEIGKGLLSEEQKSLSKKTYDVSMDVNVALTSETATTIDDSLLSELESSMQQTYAKQIAGCNTERRQILEQQYQNGPCFQNTPGSLEGKGLQPSKR